ncbi:polynucleotide adenylyltransferase PcnB [Nannocystis bainbridge]|uniref:Poly(A) polymerase I n=1 Tax=Nannocystis bainbridge TaxID=2995303 RepID=A0ABT5E9C8_9BACT|nr:polynucleotide adenylyltransferase PcnB [Nannocystis bainbridge]MDC0722053.1 polynucleotide adenylyltransferase PcnB [Nannocystis bainbridge]
MPEAKASSPSVPTPRLQGAISIRDVDPDALKVVRKLVAGGHEAYLVGGCVRDLFLKRRPKDFDVATSATPEAIRKAFRNCRIIGRRFKLAHVFFGPKIIETSTFRTTPITAEDDPLITHDNEWGSVEDDARRRDFTINGLFYDTDADAIVDFVDGLADLERGVIRTIGDPLLRFQEDPVRMLRAVKFAARLDFTIEEATWRALLDTVGHIGKCSRARVLEEIYKLLRGGAARRSFELLLEARLMTELMPSYVDLYRKLSPNGLAGPASKTRAGEPSRVMWNLLEALDEYTSATSQIASNGVLLAVLFAPLLDEQWHTASRQGLDRLIDDLMGPVCVSLGVARRDRELARQILMAHRRMVESLNRKKRRPSLVQRQYFHEALVFLGLTVKARGGDGSELGHWQRLAAVTQPLRVESEGDYDSGPRRKRRRRTRPDGRRHSAESGSP